MATHILRITLDEVDEKFIRWLTQQDKEAGYQTTIKGELEDLLRVQLMETKDLYKRNEGYQE